MSKNKKQDVKTEKKIAEMRMQPTYYAFQFDSIPESEYLKMLKVLFSNPDFKEAVEKRNRLVKAVGRTQVMTTATQNLLRTVQQHDRRLADTVYATMVQANIHAETGREYIPLDALLKYYVDYAREDMHEHINMFAADVDKLTFLADLLESKLIDIKENMKYIFGDGIKFEQFDGVQHVLTQLRGFFLSVHNKAQENTPEAQLYFEYADSINEYLDKRLKTYTTKYRKMHPVAYGYTARDIIDALDSFFGTKGKFGNRHVARTPSGGMFISHNIIYDLTPEEMKKLDTFSDIEIPADSSSDAMKRYCFALTDAIMKLYKPTPHNA